MVFCKLFRYSCASRHAMKIVKKPRKNQWFLRCPRFNSDTKILENICYNKCIFLLRYRLNVRCILLWDFGRLGTSWELFWKVWGLLGRLLEPRGALGNTLDCSLGTHGDPLGTLWIPLGDPLGTTWVPLGTIWGPSWSFLGSIQTPWGPSELHFQHY